MEKIEIMRSMLENNPENGLAWYLLGTEYLEAGNESEALYAYSQALNYCGPEFKAQIFSKLAKLTDKEETSAEEEISAEDGVIATCEKTLRQEQKDQDGQGIEAEDDWEDTLEEDLDEEEDNWEDTSEEDSDEDFEENTDNDREDDKVIRLSVFDGGKRKGEIIGDVHKVSPVNFDNVGGYEDLKDIIRMKIIKPFGSQGLFSKYKKKSGGGILMFGPPGCGKTFIAKATAGECRASFRAVHITDILDPYLGVSAQNVKDVFAKARSLRPCVLFFDEIDTIGFNRSKLASEHMRPIIDQLLTEIEGIDSDTQNMLIIGATNMPWDVDPAFKRPGRFDKVIFVPPPDKKAREAILKLKMSDRPQEKQIDYNLIAEKTELYSGADLENVVETATENVLSEILKSGKERPLNTKDLVKAVDSTRASTIEWLKTIQNFVKYSNLTGLYDDVEKYLSKRSRYL